MAGAQVLAGVPDPSFQSLSVDHWYRWETDFDLGTNQIVEVRLTDLTLMTTSTHNPTGWYLDGGAAGNAMPTGFRFFAGGSVVGNTLAFDNLDIFSNGGYSSYGAGCAGPAGTPALSGVAPYPVPRVALPFTMELTNMPMPSAPAFVMFGFSDTLWNGAPLPFDLGVIGAPGCSLLTDIVFAYPVATISGTGGLLIALPNDPSLLDGTIFTQGLAFAPGANPLGILLSNGARGSIGQ